MKIVTEMVYPITTINFATVRVLEQIWSDGGKSFDVYTCDANGDLTDCLTQTESFDSYPTAEQIADLFTTMD
jgi:hypothetical protein